ncbi:glycosyltransferase family 2 protein [Halochromatium roseum]|uniref:glycosyltransferase family 2 protein n=1 Tax=Halochromatium roseum TaxID=391920 RepID=UPI0019135088|nr:glycosyltransferase family A protein [Halochromatium roseum]
MSQPRLSIVVVAYDMAREIPRTIRSLSPLMQRGIKADDYEIILVDNGSPNPLTAEACPAHGATLRLHRQSPAPASPVAAVNTGLALARGDLIGVMIDGARLASPGLLAQALTASRLHHRPVIGTLGFHLGPKVQMDSVREGYDQQAEDALLAEVDWETDGYHLFDISVFAGSSAGGWFAMPAECNAVFLPSALWSELGGFDPGFTSAGGGLVNLDTWARACALPDSDVILLLGEGTFHQMHGGIATNRPDAPRAAWQAEYRRLRGRTYQRPDRPLCHVGTVAPQALRSIQRNGSAQQALTLTGSLATPAAAIQPQTTPVGEPSHLAKPVAATPETVTRLVLDARQQILQAEIEPAMDAISRFRR